MSRTNGARRHDRLRGRRGGARREASRPGMAPAPLPSLAVSASTTTRRLQAFRTRVTRSASPDCAATGSAVSCAIGAASSAGGTPALAGGLPSAGVPRGNSRAPSSVAVMGGTDKIAAATLSGEESGAGPHVPAPGEGREERSGVVAFLSLLPHRPRPHPLNADPAVLLHALPPIEGENEPHE